MEVAVLGAGNGGCAVAFDWAQHGHNVRLFATAKYPGEVQAIAERGEIVSTGELSGMAPISYAGHDAGRTVSGADLIMVSGLPTPPKASPGPRPAPYSRAGKALGGSQRVGAGVTFGQSFSVVDLAEAVDADLGDSDAVQGHVELPVS